MKLFSFLKKNNGNKKGGGLENVKGKRGSWKERGGKRRNRKQGKPADFLSKGERQDMYPLSSFSNSEEEKKKLDSLQPVSLGLSVQPVISHAIVMNEYGTQPNRVPRFLLTLVPAGVEGLVANQHTQKKWN